MRAHLIQEVPIVADDHHGRVIVVERAFEPADGIDIQIVGRFIQQQHVRSREQRLRQQHAQLEAGGHFAHRPVVPRFVNTGVGEDAAGPGLGIVAAVFGEHPFEFGGLHVVVVGGIGIGVDAVALLHRRPQLRVAAHDHVEHALILVAELILIQFAEPHSGLQHDIAGAGLEIASQHLHERGFAGTVGADEPVAIAVGELDRDLLEERLGAELNGDVGGGKHVCPIN